MVKMTLRAGHLMGPSSAHDCPSERLARGSVANGPGLRSTRRVAATVFQIAPTTLRRSAPSSWGGARTVGARLRRRQQEWSEGVHTHRLPDGSLHGLGGLAARMVSKGRFDGGSFGPRIVRHDDPPADRRTVSPEGSTDSARNRLATLSEAISSGEVNGLDEP
jgi:hypothetical protein